jgi:hypothetical protein
LRDFPSVLFEKDNKPYVELSGYGSSSALIDPFVLKPIYLARSKKEQFLIEPSINACRVFFSLKKDKLHNEKKRLSRHIDCHEIFKHGRSKSRAFLNDQKKTYLSN